MQQLLRLCTRYDAALASLQPLAQLLNPYGILIRYPGLSATVANAREAVKAARRCRTVLRKKLGL